MMLTIRHLEPFRTWRTGGSFKFFASLNFAPNMASLVPVLNLYLLNLPPRAI